MSLSLPFIEAASFTLANLLLMKWKDVDGIEHTFRLIDHVGSQWERIGIMLGITMSMLKKWDQQHRGDVTLCWGELVGHWKESGGTPDYPHTWYGLYQLLLDIEYGLVAENMMKFIKASESAHVLPHNQLTTGMLYMCVIPYPA